MSRLSVTADETKRESMGKKYSRVTEMGAGSKKFARDASFCTSHAGRVNGPRALGTEGEACHEPPLPGGIDFLGYCDVAVGPRSLPVTDLESLEALRVKTDLGKQM